MMQMTDSDNKQKKRAEEIAIQIKEYEKRYDIQLKESRKLIEIMDRDYQNLLIEQQTNQIKTENKVNETKKQQVLKAGQLLEKFYPIHKISIKLQRDFVDRVPAASIRRILYEEGKHWSKQKKKSSRKKNVRPNILSPTISEPLTQQDQDYVQAYEQELIRGELFRKIVNQLTNKENEDFVAIRKRTPQGKNWAQTLLEESKEHMLVLAHQMTDSALEDTLDDLRVITTIADGFSKIVYSVKKQRESQPKE